MFNISDPSVSQDQTLALQSQVLSYVREALNYDKGCLVFSIKDLSAFEFEIYYSDGNNVDARYEETREETIRRILFTLNCKELKSVKGDINAINDLIRYLFNYIVGVISLHVMNEKYSVADHSGDFKWESPNE